MNILQRTHYQVLEELCLKKVLSQLLKHSTEKDVLDVGCGHGKYLRLLQKMQCNPVGVDINPKQIQALTEEGFTVYTNDNLPKDKSYDIILMAHIIEHLHPHELTEFLNTYLPLLKEHGKLIVITPVLGARFYYDSTHIRPYYPQSLWMMMGDLNTPLAYRSNYSMSLEDIYFFKDSWRLREWRSFYPTPPYKGQAFLKEVCRLCNLGLAYLHYFSGGRLGTTASWLGIYGRLLKKDCLRR